MEKVGIQVEMLDGDLHLVPLDDIIFIQVERKTCSFYLKEGTPEATIGLTKLWEMIEEAGKGYDHHLKKVGRKHIINMDCIDRVDRSKLAVVLRRDPYTIMDPEVVKKNTRELPKEVLNHVKALKELQGRSDSEKKEEVPVMYYEVEIGDEPMKKLLQDLKKQKRIEVLGNYALIKKLTVPVEELNDEYLTEAGYEYVDLGLPSGTLWAAENLNGDSYFAWGELYENDIFDEKEYIHKKGLTGLIDSQTSALSLKYDAARHFRGGGWRMPTKEECEELLNECILSWCITEDRVHGCLLTGPNGNRIFLPARGLREGDRLNKWDDLCAYWTSSNKENGRPSALKVFEIEDEELELNRWVASDDPYRGLPIRPVISKGGLTGQEGNLKRMLFLNDEYFVNEEDRVMQDNDLIMDGWIIKRFTPPVKPEEAINVIANALKKFNPDVVVAFKTSCFWGQVIKKDLKFLVEPGWKISEGMKNYMATEQVDLEEKDWLVTQDMIDYYESKEEVLTTKDLKDTCWILAEEPWDLDDPQFDRCNSVELLPTNNLTRWANTRLLPIIKEVTDRLSKGPTGEKTLYERKFVI